MRHCDRSCDSYVKLVVTSDLQKKAMRTQTIRNNRRPKYQETFTLCVSDELLRSRLQVSVFSRSCDSRCRQLIGCMSFGVGSLVSCAQNAGKPRTLLLSQT
ncbi:regulator of G-protein signaling 3-like [Salarias fasciatus]|uniref:regulator of G-protein signaling 3-like n=1 Tax=Salarias fasciatus TaxID=181472 RepID=UPI001176F079|nr:regulator of G-protein signaling 3-like [Salarias fasciatus]